MFLSEAIQRLREAAGATEAASFSCSQSLQINSIYFVDDESRVAEVIIQQSISIAQAASDLYRMFLEFDNQIKQREEESLKKDSL